MEKREMKEDLTVRVIGGSVVLSFSGTQMWLEEEAAGELAESILLALEVISRNNGGLYVNN